VTPYDALLADGVRPDVALSAVQRSTPSHLSENWRGLYVHIAEAKALAVQFDDDRRHARKPLYWRCVMPQCRHCGVKAHLA
jgi:hypothetical protein